MAQFSVHENPNPRTKGDVPYLLDVQSDVISVLATRMVVPLYRQGIVHSKTMTRLTPVVRLKNKPLIAMVPEMAGIHQRELGTIVGDLSAARGELIQAIDLLLTGF
ncbi:MAG: CcdB family protein [Holophaga sp.]|nr:CcdB family protein [Holophaga sp.]